MNTFLSNLSMQSKRSFRIVWEGLRAVPHIKLSVLRKVFSLMDERERLIALILLIVSVVTFIFSSIDLTKRYTEIVPAHGGVYNEGIIGQPQFINPLYAISPTDRALVNLIYSGLYKYDNNGNVVPDLAESFPEVTEEGKVYKVKIKPATWHNGLPVTASDVVFTIKTIQDQEFNSPKRTEWLSTTATAVDQQTVVFTLKNASAPFLNNLTLPLISEVVWSKVNPADLKLAQTNIEAVGTGPYTVKEVKKLEGGSIQSITLKSYDKFYTGEAFLDTLHINFYEDGDSLLKAKLGNQIDGFGFSQFEERVSIKQSAKDLHIHQIPLPQYQAVFLNTAIKTLGDARVRKALNLATNKQQILSNVYDEQGLIIDGPILTQHVSNLPEPVKSANIEEANKILDQANWVLNRDTNIRSKNGVELKFTIATNDRGINKQTAEILAEQWKAIGVGISLNILPTKELTENVIKPRNYDMLIFAQKLGADPDPFVFWHSSQTKSPGLNLSSYSNQAVDQLISEARATSDKSERDQKYLQLHELMKQDLPAIFLVQSVYTYAIDEDIKGVDIQSLPDETARFYNLRNWYIDTRRALKKNS